MNQTQNYWFALPCRWELLFMQAPNPSIERTRPGKPGRASHVTR